MRAVVDLAAHDLRARWRGWAALALLVAIAGGAVLVAAAGASRTESAYPRFLMASKASDVLVAPDLSGLGGYFGALARLPGVGAVAPVVGLALEPAGNGSLAARNANTMGPADGRFGRLLEVPKVLAGRLPDAGRAGEIAVDQRGAAMLGLRVGSVLAMRAVPNGPLPGAAVAGQGPARPRLLRERVVGIVVTRGSVLPVTEQDKAPVIIASPSLFRQLGMRYAGYSGAFVKLRPGTSAEEFRRQAQSLTHRFPATGGHVLVADENAQAAAVRHAIQPEAIALGIFALVLAVTGLLIVGQAATRLLAAGSLNNPALAALGMTRGQLMAAGLIKVGAGAFAGAVAAAGVAVAASPLMPIGAARLAEPDPGVSADAMVLGPAWRPSWCCWWRGQRGRRGAWRPPAPGGAMCRARRARGRG